MELKDYISVAALLISITSLTISFRGASFTRRAKSAEIRVAILSKISDLSLANSRIHQLQSDLLALCKKRDDGEFIQLLGEMEIEDAVRETEHLYKDLSKLPVSSALTAYEAFFHRLHRASNVSQEIEGRLQSIKARYENRPSSAKA